MPMASQTLETPSASKVMLLLHAYFHQQVA